MKRKMLEILMALTLTAVIVLPVSAAGTGDEIVILYTNDVHCGVDDNLGYAALAGYKAQQEELYEYVTLVDVGDSIQGDVIGALSDGVWPVELMNQVGYDLTSGF